MERGCHLKRRQIIEELWSNKIIDRKMEGVKNMANKTIKICRAYLESNEMPIFERILRRPDWTAWNNIKPSVSSNQHMKLNDDRPFSITRNDKSNIILDLVTWWLFLVGNWGNSFRKSISGKKDYISDSNTSIFPINFKCV